MLAWQHHGNTMATGCVNLLVCISIRRLTVCTLQDPSRELMQLVSSMTEASMPEADKEEVVSFATR